MRPHKRLVFRDRDSRKLLSSTPFEGKGFPASLIRTTMIRLARKRNMPEEELQIVISIEKIFY